MIHDKGSLSRAVETKQQQAAICKRLRKGELTLRDIIREPPEAFEKSAIYQVLTLCAYPSTRRGPVIRELGRDAVAAGVNLFQTLKTCPPSQREWLLTWLETNERRLFNRPRRKYQRGVSPENPSDDD